MSLTSLLTTDPSRYYDNIQSIPSATEGLPVCACEIAQKLHQDAGKLSIFCNQAYGKNLTSKLQLPEAMVKPEAFLILFYCSVTTLSSRQAWTVQSRQALSAQSAANVAVLSLRSRF